MISYGALLALFTVFLWALGNCMLALSIHFLGVHPIACIMQIYIWAGVTLLMIGSFSSKNKQVSLRETFKEPITWIYGAAELCLGLFLMLVLVTISPTEESFLSRMSIIIALILGLALFAKKPSRLDWQCLFPMLAGLIIIIAGMDYENMVEIFVLIVLAELALVIRGLAAEHHPVFKRAESIRQRCRVTGAIVLLSGVFICGTLLGLALLKDQFVMIQNMFPALPSVSDFTHTPTIVFAMLQGAVLIALTRYLYFRSVSLISNTTFLMFAACTPFMTYFLQELLNLVGLLPSTLELTWSLVVGGLLVTFSSLWAAFAREITTSDDKLNKIIDDVTAQQEERIAKEQRFIDAINPDEKKS